MSLTAKQERILTYIRSRQVPPTFREIGQEFGIKSTNGVDYHLRKLEQAGAITHETKRSRTIAAVPRRAVLPLHGLVTADGHVSWGAR